MTKISGIVVIGGSFMTSIINNPFNVTFGEEPNNAIPRDSEISQITNAFDSEFPESKVFIVCGPRGSGKTVLISQVKKIYDQRKDWITIDLNPYGDLIEQMCAKLYEAGLPKHLFLKTEFNFSFKGLGFTISGENPVSNLNTLSEKMLSYLKKKGIRVLLVIDDVLKNEYTQYFVHSFQSYIREKYDLFLLMSGLYDNISSLENEKGLTFFIRAPKIYLNKLSQVAIANAYSRLLSIDSEKAIALSKLTMGYAYGFQLLGNLLYKNNKVLDDELLGVFDATLENNVYSFIWQKLSPIDKKIVLAVANGHTKVEDIIKELNINNSKLQVYKNRLSKMGIIDASTRGTINISLPRFKEYAIFQNELEN